MCRFLLLCLFLLGGCHHSDRNLRNTLKINIGSDPTTLDPRKARDLTAVTITRMLYEGLARVSKLGEVELALAQDVEVSEDGKRYIFHLRKSVWSNGEPVTSFDFAETWKSILNPQFPTDIAYQLFVIKNARIAKLGEIALDKVGIETPDASTLVVELEGPVPYFLQLLATSPFLPLPRKTIVANPTLVLDVQTYVGNGPFVLADWKHSDQMHLVKNPRYWEAKKVHLSGISLLMIPGDTEMRMFEIGKLDWAGSPLSTIPVDAVNFLRASDQLRISPFSATYFLRLNTADKIGGKKNPLGSLAFRKALSYALDRDSLTAHVLQGGHIKAFGLVPPAMGLCPRGYFRDKNASGARALLTDALLELDLTLETLEPIRLSYSSNERNANMAQAMQRQWEEVLGIKVDLEAVESKTYFQRISQRDFHLAVGSWTADFDDPINFLEVFKYKDSSTNNTGWENLKYVDLLERSALCRSGEERKGLLREAEQILMEQMPIIPIFHFVLNYVQRDGLSDVMLSPLGQMDFRWARLDSMESSDAKR